MTVPNDQKKSVNDKEATIIVPVPSDQKKYVNDKKETRRMGKPAYIKSKENAETQKDTILKK